MDSQGSRSLRGGLEQWIAPALAAAVAVGWAVQQLAPDPEVAQGFAPGWLPLLAAGIAAAGTLPREGPPLWQRARSALRWSGLLLLVWAANGLPFDLLTMVGLVGHRTATGPVVLSTVYWPGLATRSLALATAIVP